MAVEIPPGILYLLRFSPHLLTPALITYFLNYVTSLPVSRAYIPSVLARFLPLSGSHLVSAVLSSVPLFITLRILWGDLKVRVEARRLGAVLPPRIVDWSPGGIVTLIKVTRMVNGGYIGERLLLDYL